MPGTLPEKPYVAPGPPDYDHGRARGANRDGKGSLCESRGNTTPLSDVISHPKHSNVFQQGDPENGSTPPTFLPAKNYPIKNLVKFCMSQNLDASPPVYRSILLYKEWIEPRHRGVVKLKPKKKVKPAT